ncbi:MAG: M56 family metallopeptidase [Nitriliruptorales bacterium]|nr:M56 family metallopeptidase [Nitriliruptorales bacterium]
MSGDLLVTLPLDSIAFRAMVASLVAVIAARLLLRVGLRVPRVRVLAALLPAVALLGVLALNLGNFNLPTIMVPVDSGSELSVPIQGGYLHFASAAVPILLGTWLLVASWRVLRRVRGHVLAVRAARHAFTVAPSPSPRIRRIACRLARRLDIPPPAVAVTDDVSGGAVVIGIRRPVLLLDRALVDGLDNAELRGVIGHELAHVARRDNLLALVTGLIGDVAFFVPMRRWMLQRLCEEREFAADQVVTAATRRPGALASGLLKAMARTDPAPLGATALVDGVTVVRRVEALVSPTPAPTRLRGGVERAAVAVSLGVVMLGTLALPGAAGGSSGTHGIGVLWHAGESSATADLDAEARVFDVYRDVALTADHASVSRLRVDDDPWDFHPGVLRACADHGSCPSAVTSSSLGLRPRPHVRFDNELRQQWTAERILGEDARVSLIRLTRSE